MTLESGSVLLPSSSFEPGREPETWQGAMLRARTPLSRAFRAKVTSGGICPWRRNGTRGPARASESSTHPSTPDHSRYTGPFTNELRWCHLLAASDLPPVRHAARNLQRSRNGSATIIYLLFFGPAARLPVGMWRRQRGPLMNSRGAKLSPQRRGDGSAIRSGHRGSTDIQPARRKDGSSAYQPRMAVCDTCSREAVTGDAGGHLG